MGSLRAHMGAIGCIVLIKLGVYTTYLTHNVPCYISVCVHEKYTVVSISLLYIQVTVQ